MGGSVRFFAACLLGCGPRTPETATVIEPGHSPLSPAISAGDSDSEYVGITTCRSCHPAEATIWDGSDHAHARSTISAVNAGANPDCLPCHVTGMGAPTGWVGSRTPELENVTCEACHGPGGEHSKIAGAPLSGGYGRLPRSAASCVGCHTTTTSPDFAFVEYWAKIRH